MNNLTMGMRVSGLTVGYRKRGVVRRIVDDVSFDVPQGTSLALVGESGSGKSTIANTILRLGSDSLVVEGGEVTYLGRSLLKADAAELRAVRGNEIGYVPQDPANSLNPVRTIGAQLAETLVVTDTRSAREIDTEILTDLLDQVGIPAPDKVIHKFPGQLSGGMLQRVLIASAIAAQPTLLIADEPTSALDVTVQRRVLDLIDQLRTDLGLTVLFITHDLALARERCDDVVVLRHGQVQEVGPSTVVLNSPRSEYTRQLLADVPALNTDRFRSPAGSASSDVTPSHTVPVVELVNVSKRFGRQHEHHVLALDSVSLQVTRGTTHAIVGESGSGKTTIARTILGLETPTEGTLLLDGVPVSASDRKQLDALRSRTQLVYQNPFVSLDPSFSAAQSVAEPLARHRIGNRASRSRRARELLLMVGLPESTHRARPRGLSGGQRQRVAIARALALDPELLVLDEPTSALDVTVQATILQLVVTLQHEVGTTYVLISHDLGIVRQVADDITVIKHGIVVESGPASTVFESPTDPYTRDLITSVPGWGWEHTASRLA